MKKPWQIWSLYALCLLVVVPAMAWLSVQSLNLEKAREEDRIQTELARREAELQERISSALWRMDGFLTNLIAREATRPWYLYQSFYDVAAFEPQFNFQSSAPAQTEGQQLDHQQDSLSYRLASPLLFQPSQFVRLHFEIDRNNTVTSPQIPNGADRSQAFMHGLSEDAWRSNRKLANEVKFVCSYGSLLSSCSTDLLPEGPFEQDERNSYRSFPPPSDLSQRIEQTALAPKVAPARGEEFSFFQLATNALTLELNRLKRQRAENKQQQPGGKGQVKPTQKQVAQQTRNMSRGENEYGQRQMNADAYAMTEWVGNKMIEPQMAGDIANTRLIREGVMQPMWIDDRLILARRVVKDDEQIIQGCWLDWQKIRVALTDLVSDLLPEVNYQSIEDPDQVILGQALATLPVQLVIDRPRMIETLTLEANAADEQLQAELGRTSILKQSLWIAWIGLAFAAIAGAFLLHGVMRLSERRGAFVSAVSHELRTPLTTFRMYAEMMAEKMVPADRQQQYAQTLKVEADRLWHLVENVLQFARLERSNQKNRLEDVTLDEVLERFHDRLEGRAIRANMELVVDLPDEVRKQEMRTDPGAIEQILFNLVDNACKYARDTEDRRVVVSGSLLPTGQMRLSVRDFGPGVNKDDRNRMFEPFRKSDMVAANTAQGVGLGLALCRRMAKSLGGRLTVADLAAGESGAKLVLEIPVKS
ncbi:MAG: sensor histidine kinase [Pirellulaceae bacterium]